MLGVIDAAVVGAGGKTDLESRTQKCAPYLIYRAPTLPAGMRWVFLRTSRPYSASTTASPACSNLELHYEVYYAP